MNMSRLILLALFLCGMSACGPQDGAPTPVAETAESVSQPTEVSAVEQAAMDEAELIERARAIHERVIVLDTHVDINTRFFTDELNYTQDTDTQVNLPKKDAGGLDVSWFVVYTAQGPLTEEGYEAAYDNAMDKFHAIHRLVNDYAPDRIELATTSEDVRRIIADGKKVAMIGVENAYPLADDLGRIEQFYELGARYMSLSHNRHSQLADSHTGEADGEWLHNGLSDMGRQAIAEMNRLGIMIDLSHPSIESNRQAIELSVAPVMASHSSARTVNDVSRNLRDEELLAIRDTGGVVQAVAFRSFVNAEKHARYQEAMNTLLGSIADDLGYEILGFQERNALEPDARAVYDAHIAEINALAEPRIEAEVHAHAPPVDVADFIDHVDYMVELIGIDHVGLSGDFDGGGGVEGWMGAHESLNITIELVRRGYSEEDIAKIWGENLLRVLDEVQAVAARLQAD